MMRACLWVVLVLSLALSAFAAPPPKPKLVHWMNYTEALEKAKGSSKLIFVDLYADWCVPCFGLPFSLLRIGAFLTAKYSVKE